jgi:predicted nucleic-acid-binding Zn-ribbon protein
METANVIKCDKCGSENLEKTIWRSPRSYFSREVEITMAKYNLNQIPVYKCLDCGSEMRRW